MLYKAWSDKFFFFLPYFPTFSAVPTEMSDEDVFEELSSESGSNASLGEPCLGMSPANLVHLLSLSSCNFWSIGSPWRHPEHTGVPLSASGIICSLSRNANIKHCVWGFTARSACFHLDGTKKKKGELVKLDSKSHTHKGSCNNCCYPDLWESMTTRDDFFLLFSDSAQ